MHKKEPKLNLSRIAKLDDSRLNEGLAWANSKLELTHSKPEPVSGDASFRRYFRLSGKADTFILMDAPPELEDSRAFHAIAARLRTAGLRAPIIHHFDFERGFGLLEDLGDTLYREILSADTASQHFPDLLAVLTRLASEVDASGLPRYDAEKLQQELDLFVDWYLLKHRNRVLDQNELPIWNETCEKLRQSAQEQPQVFVHRDFHSCNLLYEPGKAAGIIDFQDALLGPISYDFISLIWDRYISWPRARLEHWMSEFQQKLDLDVDQETWIKWCDWMSLQRNLKIVGIFARLHYRDRKGGYIELIPRFYQYLLDVLERYPEFRDFQRFLEHDECTP